MKTAVDPATPYLLDRADVRSAFDRASSRYDDIAIIDSRVREEMLSRLDLVKLSPAVILDVGCGTCGWAAALLKRFRRSRLLALDISTGMLNQAQRRKPWFRKLHAICADGAALPIADNSVDLICSSLMLPWCNDPDLVFREFRRVLTPGGLLTFATLGPDTLGELRNAWRAADDHVHVNRFIDMHDIGDALVRAGLAEPVLDVDQYRLNYDTVDQLMRDLKAIGANNINAGRSRGLTSRQRLRAVESAYDKVREDGRLPVTVEVVYGQAWGPVQLRREDRDEVTVPVGAIGRRSHGGDV